MMSRMLRSHVCRAAAWYLALTFAGVMAMPSLAAAAFITPSLPEDTSSLSEAAIRALEEGVLTERLSALGLSAEQITKRIESLSPDERQAVMADLDRLQAGGDGVGAVVGLAILILIIILIVKLLDKEIVIH